jgi:putative intracellular protease/amidase
MKQVFFLRVFFVLCCLFGLTERVAAASANDEEKGIRQAIHLYLNGTSFNDREEINKAFYVNARLYLPGQGNALREMGAQEYAQLFAEDKKGQFNGRLGRLISMDVSGEIATAKAEILMLQPGIRFVDVFLLKKIQGTWQIISKTASRENAPQHGRKILFVVSNAQQYPGTATNTGNNFPELAYAYQTFIKAGYAVDFVSQEGGSIPLEMINTSDKVQRQHLYDHDFMWALSHTKSPSDIKAADYAAINYIGGGSAIIEIADNQAIQGIALQIYEQQGGVIAAICQGTQGISNLKQSNGEFLISDKVLTSFPDRYLNQQSPVFKAYPFSLENTIKQRKGKFTSGANGTSHIEVDGRLVTGMNWESSVAVAEAVIRLLDEKK